MGHMWECASNFASLRSMPRESGEIPLSGCHESPVGQMPLTAGREATSSGAEEQEIGSQPLLPFTRAFI